MIRKIIFLNLLMLILSCSDDDGVKVKMYSANKNLPAVIAEFKSQFGNNNGNATGSQSGGFREINWDALPDEVAVPNGYVGNFFNDPAIGQTRGIEFSTPGSGLIVSADLNNPTNTLPSFGNINPSYVNTFPPYSGERIFSPMGSNIAEVRFYVPGTQKPAAVKGFGAVYIDVDRAENMAFEFFDVNGFSVQKLRTLTNNNGHVFLGVIMENPTIHRVRIEYGNSALGPDDGGNIDVSVMDDFIFSEPQEIK